MKKLMPNYIQSGIYYSCRQPLKFEPEGELVSQEDILNLFMGLCRLIKKSSEYSLENKYMSRIKYLEKLLDKNKINYKIFDY